MELIKGVICFFRLLHHKDILELDQKRIGLNQVSKGNDPIECVKVRSNIIITPFRFCKDEFNYFVFSKALKYCLKIFELQEPIEHFASIIDQIIVKFMIEQALEKLAVRDDCFVSPFFFEKIQQDLKYEPSDSLLLKE